jgi:hypothetical protein
LPMAACLFTLFLLIFWPDRRPRTNTVSFPAVAASSRSDEVFLPEAK